MRKSKVAFTAAAAGAFVLASLLTVSVTENTPNSGASSSSVQVGFSNDAAARRCCRVSFPRIRISFPRIRISFPRIRLPRINIRLPPIIRNIGRAIGNAARGIANVAKKIGDGVIKGVKTIGKGIVKIGQGVVQIAKGVGQVVGGVVKGAVKFTGGLIKAGGKLLKGDLKGAFNEVKTGAKAGFDAAKKGVTEGVKNIGQGVVKVADGVKDVAVGLVQVAMPLWDLAKDFLKKIFVDGLFKVIGSNIGGHIAKVAGVFSRSAGKLMEAIRVLNQILDAAQQVIDAVNNPEEFVDKGKEWVAEKLTDLAWRVLETPIKKVTGFLMGGLVGFVKHFITTPLSVFLSSAIAACTFGIGALATPLIKWGIDTLFDMAIEKLTDKLAELGMGIGGVRDFLKNKLIRPAIDKVYDKVMAFLKKKFPKVFEIGAKILAKAQDVANKVAPHLQKVRDVAGEINNALGKVQAVAGKVQDLAKMQRPEKLGKGPVFSVNKLIPKNLTTVVTNVKSIAKQAASLIKDPKKLKAAVVKMAGEAKKVAKNAISQIIPAIKAAPKKIAEFVKAAAKDGLVQIKTKVAGLFKPPSEEGEAAEQPAEQPAEQQAEQPAEQAQTEQPAEQAQAEQPAADAPQTEAPIVEAKPEADIEGMRAAVRTVYDLLVEDWKAGLAATSNMARKSSGLDPEAKRNLFKALVLYRRNFHDAARLSYRVRILALKFMHRDGLDEKVDAVNGALTAEGVGAAGVLQGEPEASPELVKEFNEARAALSRLAQNGERFIGASAEVATGKQAALIKRVVKSFISLIHKARQGLEDAITALKPADTSQEEKDLEAAASADEQ